MTPQDLHDALNYLPMDLVTAADKVRTAPKTTVIHWRRWVSLAAVLALVIGTTLVFARNIGTDRMKLESAVAQAPAAAAPMAPAPVEEEIAADEAMPEAPMENAAATAAAGDHDHAFAQGSDRTVNSPAYCGNMEVTVDVAGESRVLSGTDAVMITDILVNLAYDPARVCRCMAEFTVDTETLTGIQVNLTEAFARCEKGQAALTEEQAEILREILQSLS